MLQRPPDPISCRQGLAACIIALRSCSVVRQHCTAALILGPKEEMAGVLQHVLRFPVDGPEQNVVALVPPCPHMLKMGISKLQLALTTVLAVLGISSSAIDVVPAEFDVFQYVNPFIGTANGGKSFPHQGSDLKLTTRRPCLSWS